MHSTFFVATVHCFKMRRICLGLCVFIEKLKTFLLSILLFSDDLFYMIKLELGKTLKVLEGHGIYIFFKNTVDVKLVYKEILLALDKPSNTTY